MSSLLACGRAAAQDSRWADVGVVEDEAAVIGEGDAPARGGYMRQKMPPQRAAGTYATMGSLEMPWSTVCTAPAMYLRRRCQPWLMPVPRAKTHLSGGKTFAGRHDGGWAWVRGACLEAAAADMATVWMGTRSWKSWGSFHKCSGSECGLSEWWSA